MDETFQKLKFLFGRKAVWFSFGANQPIIADTVVLQEENNFRGDASLHGKYSVVWFYEYQLFDMESWPIFLDEAIYHLEEKGYLVCRLMENWNGTIFALKSYLFRNPNLDVRLIEQHKNKRNEKICVFEIYRKNFASYHSRNWSIGILTNGQKTENVCSLIRKIKSLNGSHSIEFIIAGKFEPSLLEDDLDIKIFNLQWADNLPRITEKKWEIGKRAIYENIAIFHDRYQVCDDFFTGFETFGYHFNFLTIHQTYADGTFFPGYVGLNTPLLKWKTPYFSKNFGHLFPGHFINGGLMIFKKQTLKSLSFNPLLLHNEAEDVELSFLMMNHGVVPRINTYSCAVTVGIPNTYTSTFIEVSAKKQRYLYVKFRKILIYVWNNMPVFLKNRLKYLKLYQFFKTRYW